MQCDRCHIRSATVHLRDQSHAPGTVLNLCVACATRSLGEGLAGSEVTKLISDLVARLGSPVQDPEGAAGAESPDSVRRCGVCGWTATEFATLGRLGCPACYTALGAEVAPRLRASHRADEHVGAQPETAPGKQQAAVVREAAERETLRVELEQAVAEEAFERAAQIRDALRRLG